MPRTRDDHTRSRKDGWPAHPCPLCGGAGRIWLRDVPEYVLGSRYYDLGWCDSCDLGFVAEPIDPDDLHEYYDRAREALFEDEVPAAGPGEKPESDKIDWLRSHGLLDPRGFAVDYGCGHGHFLARLLDHGWRVLGTEMADLPTSPAAEPFVDRSANPLSGVPDGSVDLFTFWHSMEHLLNPVALLEEAARTLKPGGNLIIAVPNARSLCARIFGRFWNGAVPPWHVTHWTPRALERAVSAVGLEPVRTVRFTPALDYLSWIDSATLASRSPELGPFRRGVARATRALFRAVRPLLLHLSASPDRAGTILTQARRPPRGAVEGGTAG